MKFRFVYILIIPALIYFNACGENKHNIGPCLLTVEIVVTDINDTLKQLTAVPSSGAGDETFTWDGGLYVGETYIVSANGPNGLSGVVGPGVHSVEAYSKTTLCSATNSLDVSFSSLEPTAMIIDSVKVISYPLDNVGTPWDIDGSFADVRFAMNIPGAGGMAETDELYTTQIFFDQGTYPFTFFVDFPYTITDIDTAYIVSLWNDNAPDPPTSITSGLYVGNFVSLGQVDSIEMGFSDDYPHFMMYVRWQY